MAPKEQHQYMTVSDLNNEHYTIAVGTPAARSLSSY